MTSPNEARAKVEVEDTSVSVGSQDSTSERHSQENKFFVKCEQQVSPEGKIKVGKKGWVLRIITIIGISLIAIYNLYEGLQLQDPLIVYSTLMPLHALLVFTFGWLFYRSPARGTVGDDLVSVVIPVFNQKGMIEIVIDAIYQSTYKNLEVVVVNDGSQDGTKEVLDKLAHKYPQLKVIHKKNEGKRKAVATGFFNSKG